jgi:hypothetical protein
MTPSSSLSFVIIHCDVVPRVNYSYLKGPMRVVSHNSEGIDVLRDIITQAVADYHVSRLRPFLYDERTLLPLQVAVTDSLDEFVAEAVVARRGGVHRPRTLLSFKIRWAGYGPDDDTWESWDNCRDSFAVQNFLSTHRNATVRRFAKKGYEPSLKSMEHNSDSSDSDSDNER